MRPIGTAVFIGTIQGMVQEMRNAKGRKLARWERDRLAEETGLDIFSPQVFTGKTKTRKPYAILAFIPLTAILSVAVAVGTLGLIASFAWYLNP